MSISTMNDDLNILQNLAIPAFEEDVDVIQKLDDEPNDVGGLTAAELKAKFDEAGNRIKTYLNETLVPSISETVAEAEERAEAEAARVLAEEQRAAAEQERVAAEAEREQAEAERRAGEAERAAAEAERKTAEDARALAEQNRVDTDNGIVAQATSAAEAAENAANKAASAAIHQPIVGDNGNWHTWSFDAGAYVDTGIYAGGDAPYIGENGNWYVGQTDTGVSATSSGVYVGSGDMPGGYNLQIDPDGEETDFIPYIGANGNWFVGNTDLEVPATGPIGPVGDTGATGPAGPAGSDGVDGKSAYQYAVDGGYTGTETEFAEKMAQEKFANPNALTFTGAVTGSYDGSAPLEVAIPSGGGGACGGDDVFELIGEATSSGVSDIAGLTIPFDGSLYKTIIAYAYNLPAGNQKRIIIRKTKAWYDGSPLGWNGVNDTYLSSMTKMNNTWGFFGAAIDVGGKLFTLGAAESNGNGGHGYFRFWPQNGALPTLNLSNCKFISLDCNSNSEILPDGCSLIVWGVRK